jgi:DNA-binding NtrC family response regulator
MPRRKSEGSKELGPTETEAIVAAPVVRADRAVLVCSQKGRTFVVEIKAGESIELGRDPECGIPVDQTTASRRHARIGIEDGVLFVEDLGSRNGTWVNDRRLRKERIPIAGGASIRIAEFECIAGATSAGEPKTEEEAEGEVVVADRAMHEVLSLARKVARTDTTVLVLGETGVGKEVLASRIHAGSKRAKGPLVRMHCAAIPETLLESQLFGHEKGAFTGADRKTDGFVHAANHGTLFVDEIGELSATAQVKLLRVLETKTVTRVGSTAETPVDVRFVCATHKDLQREVTDGRFREDLYYRIATFVLRVPPLRERPAEIPALAHTFGGGRPIAQDALAALLAHSWPGNVRELRNAIEHALVLAGGTIELAHLPEAVRDAKADGPGFFGELEDIERSRIEAALERCGGNQTKAAAMLGMSRRALVYRLSRWRAQSK